MKLQIKYGCLNVSNSYSHGVGHGGRDDGRACDNIVGDFYNNHYGYGNGNGNGDDLFVLEDD